MLQNRLSQISDASSGGCHFAASVGKRVEEFTGGIVATQW